MHKQLINQSKIMVDISPVTPLLIKSGVESADPSLPDMNFVRTHHPEYGEIVYIPGSSFKGVLRSYTEKILRTLDIRCCNPLNLKKAYSTKQTDGSCNRLLEDKAKEAKKTKKEVSGVELYRESCYACRTFGSTAVASRVKCVDGYPQKGKFRTEKRSGVAIDRVLGSVAVGPFDLEIVTSGIFGCEIFMSNFQLWQLGLIGLVLRDLDQGYTQLGFAKSRGLGQVEAEIRAIEISYIKRPPADINGNLYGVGVFEDLAGQYGFLKQDAVPTKKEPVEQGFRTGYRWEGSEISQLFEEIIGTDKETEIWKTFLNVKGA